jgi:alpha-L-fucosidase
LAKTKNDWGSVELLKLVRKLQPGIIVNNRLDLDDYEDGADFVTPEGVSTKELGKYKGKTWETCQTSLGCSCSWGYWRDKNTWKTHKQLLDLLITSVSNGGNLLINIGPTARGEFDYHTKNALDSLSQWMYANSKSIYNCSFAPEIFLAPANDKLTYNATTKRLFVHLYDYPSTGALTLYGYKGKIKYAQFLHDNSELQYKEQDNDIVLTLPVKRPGYEIPVVELVLN